MVRSSSRRGIKASTVKLRQAKGDRAKTTPRKESSQTRRARRDRGADTRTQLIEAALDVFGRLGYEGASTREIAKAAGANLAAIVYHFGGKEGLHLAVAEHIATSIAQKIGPTLAAVAGPETSATPKAARAALHKLIETFIEVILGSAEAERWARFIVREQMQPTAAFDVIYRFLGGAATTATRLVAAALSRPDDEETRVRVFTFLGQVLVFRVAQTLVLRRMEWTVVEDPQRALIKRVVLGQIDHILDAERKPGEKS
jgi:TetR/AcrR family transcriptional regulator, regulator of cefoperazone and chloramphenicol sensitivity